MMAIFNPIRVLVVDDEESIRRLAEKEISGLHRTVQTAGTSAEALDLLTRAQFDVVVLDVRLPDADGLELLEKIRDAAPDLEVILITGYGDIDSAVQAMKAGAYDYITKPFSLDRLELVIEKAYQRVCLQREIRQLRHNQSRQTRQQLVGRSSGIQRIHYLVEKVAPTNVPVLITGESGTGKDVVARAVHERSQRAGKPLIVKNCGTLQRELVRSELFGHCKGAFTGANESQEGLVAIAHQGTLFLDEIGELSLEVQASLLRLLESQTYRRVGDKQERKVDVRFLFATNRNLTEEVAKEKFHEALYHRLNVFQIGLPPLRERKEDIPLLVEYFLVLLAEGSSAFRVSKNVMQHLLAYNWPGNIRELRNVIERGIIFAENGLITERALPLELFEQRDDSTEESHLCSLQELERRHIARVLSDVDGNRSQASTILGVSRKTLYRKLRDYGIDSQ